MKTVKVYLKFTDVHCVEVEVDDDATEEEIEETATTAVDNSTQTDYYLSNVEIQHRAQS